MICQVVADWLGPSAGVEFDRVWPAHGQWYLNITIVVHSAPLALQVELSCTDIFRDVLAERLNQMHPDQRFG